MHRTVGSQGQDLRFALVEGSPSPQERAVYDPEGAPPVCPCSRAISRCAQDGTFRCEEVGRLILLQRQVGDGNAVARYDLHGVPLRQVDQDARVLVEKPTQLRSIGLANREPKRGQVEGEIRASAALRMVVVAGSRIAIPTVRPLRAGMPLPYGAIARDVTLSPPCEGE